MPKYKSIGGKWVLVIPEVEEQKEIKQEPLVKQDNDIEVKTSAKPKKKVSAKKKK